MTRFRRSLLVISLVPLWAPSGDAALAPLALLVDDQPVPAALLLPYGLLSRGDGGAGWLACWQRFDAATDGLLTANRRVLVGGPAGPWNTNDDGCRFESTDGIAEKRAVTGLYAPVPGDLEVLIAYDDGVAPSGVALSRDGGITTKQSGDLTFAESGVSDLLGAGDVVWAVTRHRQTGALGVWRSADRGLTSAAIPVGGVPGGDATGLKAAAASDDQIWFWSGDDLLRLSADGAWTATGFAMVGSPKSALVASDGALWAGSPEAGLLRLTPDGTSKTVSSLPTAALAARGARLWVAHVAAAPGDPLVSGSEDLGATWTVVMVASAEVAHPPLCTTLVSQTCAPAVLSYRDALGVSAPAPDAAAEDGQPAPSGQGCGAAGRGFGWFGALIGLLVYAQVSRRSRIRDCSSISPRSVATSRAVTRA
jgi:hypothetical protein